MNTRDEHMETYDAYQMGKLSGAEKEAFEKRLLESEELKLDFERYQQEVTLIGSLGIREEMKEVMDKHRDERKSKLRLFIPLGVAAALAIILLVLPKKAVDHESLFRQHFEPYPNAVSARAQQDQLLEAMQLYESASYQEALAQYRLLHSSDTVNFYAALSHLALEQPEQALDYFRKVPRNSLFFEAQQWYRALTFMLLDNRDSSSYYLRLVRTNDANYEEAQKLLQYWKTD